MNLFDHFSATPEEGERQDTGRQQMGDMTEREAQERPTAPRAGESAPRIPCDPDATAPGMDAEPSLAMVYSPYQGWGDLFPVEECLARGTLFRGLYKPFEGEGRGDE